MYQRLFFFYTCLMQLKKALSKCSHRAVFYYLIGRLGKHWAVHCAKGWCTCVCMWWPVAAMVGEFKWDSDEKEAPSLKRRRKMSAGRRSIFSWDGKCTATGLRSAWPNQQLQCMGLTFMHVVCMMSFSLDCSRLVCALCVFSFSIIDLKVYIDFLNTC